MSGTRPCRCRGRRGDGGRPDGCCRSQMDPTGSGGTAGLGRLQRAPSMFPARSTGPSEHLQTPTRAGHSARNAKSAVTSPRRDRRGRACRGARRAVAAPPLGLAASSPTWPPHGQHPAAPSRWCRVGMNATSHTHTQHAKVFRCPRSWFLLSRRSMMHLSLRTSAAPSRDQRWSGIFSMTVQTWRRNS